jgi:IS5 family transposase
VEPGLQARIEPFYPKAGRGRRPYPLGVMLRVHCVQLFYNLSDPGMEDLLYEVESVIAIGRAYGPSAMPRSVYIRAFC